MGHQRNSRSSRYLTTRTYVNTIIIKIMMHFHLNIFMLCNEKINQECILVPYIHQKDQM